MISRNKLFLLMCVGVVAVGQNAYCDDDISTKAINEQRVSSVNVYGRSQTNQVVDDKAVLGGKAKRVVAKGDGNAWDAAAQSTTTGKIKAGDEIVCVAFLKAFKTENAAPAKVALRLQESAAPYTEIKQEVITIGSEWSQYQISAIAGKDYGRGEAAFVVQVAYADQTIDVGPMFILNMNKTKPGSR